MNRREKRMVTGDRRTERGAALITVLLLATLILSAGGALVLTSTLEDPTYLTQPMITAAHVRKQADAAGWNPTPCTAR